MSGGDLTSDTDIMANTKLERVEVERGNEKLQLVRFRILYGIFNGQEQYLNSDAFAVEEVKKVTLSWCDAVRSAVKGLEARHKAYADEKRRRKKAELAKAESAPSADGAETTPPVIAPGAAREIQPVKIPYEDLTLAQIREIVSAKAAAMQEAHLAFESAQKQWQRWSKIEVAVASLEDNA